MWDASRCFLFVMLTLWCVVVSLALYLNSAPHTRTYGRQRPVLVSATVPLMHVSPSEYRMTKKSMEEEDDVESSPTRKKNEMSNLYRVVANNDAEWFDKYVVNILGQDVTNEILVQASSDLKSFAKKKPSAEKQPSTSNEQNEITAEARKIKPNNSSDDKQTSVQTSRKQKTDGQMEPSSLASTAQDSVESSATSVEDPSSETMVEDPKKTRAIFIQKDKEQSKKADIDLKSGALENQELVVPRQTNITEFSNASVSENATSKVSQVYSTKEPTLSDNNNATHVAQSHNNNTTKEPSSSSSSLRENVTTVVSGQSHTKNKNKTEEITVVLFRDLYSQRLRWVPLANITNLGYNKDDIPLLQPEVLTLIVTDHVRKPRTGIPPRWRVSDGQIGAKEEVWILTQSEAETLLEEDSSKKKKQENKTTDASRIEKERAEDSDNYRVKMSRSRIQNQTDRNVERKRIEQREKEGEEESVRYSSPSTRRPRQRERRRSSINNDGSRKRIYNGRPSSTGQIVKVRDPPPPKKFWMDIDTFRSLLRTEAELRVRLLGDNWADAVRDESEWRLDLYKKWLWTLARGVGNPIVPSRSERFRAREALRREKLKADKDYRPKKRRKNNNRNPSASPSPRESSKKRDRYDR